MPKTRRNRRKGGTRSQTRERAVRITQYGLLTAYLLYKMFNKNGYSSDNSENMNESTESNESIIKDRIYQLHTLCMKYPHLFSDKFC